MYISGSMQSSEISAWATIGVLDDSGGIERLVPGPPIGVLDDSGGIEISAWTTNRIGVLDDSGGIERVMPGPPIG